MEKKFIISCVMAPLDLFEKQFTTMITMLNDKQISELINMLNRYVQFIDKHLSAGDFDNETIKYYKIASSYCEYILHMFLLGIFHKRPLTTDEELTLTELENNMFSKMDKKNVKQYVDANGRRKEYYENMPDELSKTRGNVEMKVIKPVGDC